MRQASRAPRSTQARRLDLEPVFTTDELPIEGQTLSGGSMLVHFANFVKLPHTAFALPFALLGVVYASYVSPVTWRTLVLVVAAAVLLAALEHHVMTREAPIFRQHETPPQPLRVGRQGHNSGPA